MQEAPAINSTIDTSFLLQKNKNFRWDAMEKLVNCRRFITMDIDATKTVV
jgi:hypothetical protein